MIKSKYTTISGILGLVSLITSAASLLMDGNPTTNPDWAAIVPQFLLAIGLLFAKDFNVTGGTR